MTATTTTRKATAKATKAKATVAPVVELGADLSPALRAMEAAWRMIRNTFPDTPDVTIVIKRDDRAWGHTTVAKVWGPAASANDTDAKATRFEIMISGENLRRGADAVAGTLLHEAAHARNLNAGILDTDSNGRHNKKFAATAEDHGLTVTERGWHGWAATELSDEGKATSLQGLELARLQVGVDYRVSEDIAISPVIGASLSTFISEDSPMTTEYTEIDDKDVAITGFAGIAGRFDFGGTR
jgi:hypothetical protein